MTLTRDEIISVCKQGLAKSLQPSIRKKTMTDNMEINAFASATDLDQAEAAKKAHLLKQMEEMANEKQATDTEAKPA